MKNPNDKNQEIENFFSDSRNSEVPPEVEARLRRRLLSFRKKMEQTEYELNRKEKFIMYLMSASKSPQFRWSVGTVFTIFAIVLVLISSVRLSFCV